MGGKEQSIARQAMRYTGVIPKSILNAPELMHGLGIYLDAFFNLSTDRQIGFGALGPIPWSSIQQYAEVNEFDEDQSYQLLYFIKQMDAAFLKHMEESKPKKGS